MSKCLQTHALGALEMIVIHLTVTEAVDSANDLKTLMYSLQHALTTETKKTPEEIAISGGTSAVMSTPYGAMMTVEFLYQVMPEEANRITLFAATALSGMLSESLVQRNVIAYPSIRGVLPPVIPA